MNTKNLGFIEITECGPPGMTPEQIKEFLSRCQSTERHYRHLSGLRYTDGVRHMAELCRAYWLLDAIASHQPRCHRDPLLRQMQFWQLKQQDDGSWILICERDMNDIAIRQKIEYSDFPLDEAWIWVHNGVMLLPSEYQSRVAST